MTWIGRGTFHSIGLSLPMTRLRPSSSPHAYEKRLTRKVRLCTRAQPVRPPPSFPGSFCLCWVEACLHVGTSWLGAPQTEYMSLVSYIFYLLLSFLFLTCPFTCHPA
ncbi:hypothetical protein BCR43DRAFT_490918 [Syncephalastrum racemosum]|uniref:Uncharacterized protein n=1 Tax=Syncephalastrum racemosum TaxID=13706 RepID=A0A1X2HGS4_SYNRA|nr:hypothetical protein BCR43DRAFT_490918 [Syncephalastrum racemosum]